MIKFKKILELLFDETYVESIPSELNRPKPSKVTLCDSFLSTKVAISAIEQRSIRERVKDKRWVTSSQQIHIRFFFHFVEIKAFSHAAKFKALSKQ
jgi:hypothetical protein